MLRVIFLGTPEFGVPSLKALLADPVIEVVGVMTQPDRPSGRGQKLMPPPIKVLAEAEGLPVRQPLRLRKEPDMIEWLRSYSPDYLVTAAFGQILPQAVLDIPKYGTVNVHASLLPKYRGANPVQWAILNGDTVAGVTTMFTELDVDTGPMLLKAETPIGPDETTGLLTMRLAELGAGILPQSLKDFAAGTLQATPQDHSQATHAPKRSKEDAALDWRLPAQQVHNLIRAHQPWPGTVTQISDIQLKVIQSRSLLTWTAPVGLNTGGQPGDILLVSNEGLVVLCGDGPLLIELVQPPGKPKMPAKDWANGTLRHLDRHHFQSVSPVEVI